jgi:hypothetical protein
VTHGYLTAVVVSDSNDHDISVRARGNEFDPMQPDKPAAHPFRAKPKTYEESTRWFLVWPAVIAIWSAIKNYTLPKKCGASKLSDELMKRIRSVKVASVRTVSVSCVSVVLESSKDPTFKSNPFWLYATSDVIAFVLVLIATHESNRIDLLKAIELNMEGMKSEDFKKLKAQLAKVGHNFSEILGKPGYSSPHRGTLCVNGGNVRFFDADSAPPTGYEPVGDNHSLRLANPLFPDPQTEDAAANVTAVPNHLTIPLGQGHTDDDTAHQTAGHLSDLTNRPLVNGTQCIIRQPEADHVDATHGLNDTVPVPIVASSDQKRHAPEGKEPNNDNPNKRPCTSPTNEDSVLFEQALVDMIRDLDATHGLYDTLVIPIAEQLANGK